MKLEEITRLTGYQPSMDDIIAVVTHPNRKHVDTVEDRLVFRTNVGNVTIYDVDGVSIVEGQHFTLAGKPAFRIARLVTAEGNRGQGYATLLYKWLMVNRRTSLVSDDQLTDGSLVIWKRLLQHGIVQRYNTVTHEWVELTINDIVFDQQATVLVAIGSSCVIPVVEKGILPQTRYHTAEE